MFSLRIGILLPVLALSLALPLPALAVPAITCHCFTDRSYNPANPAAADTYFLATTQNSFFALVFNTDKKSIVMKKQQGVSGDDLWIAYRLASKSGTAADKLLQARQAGAAWPDVVAPLRLSAKALGNRLAKALKDGASDGQLAEAAVDDLFLQYGLQPEAELVKLRQAGAGNQELIIATLIAARTGQAVVNVLQKVKSGGATWGGLLHSAKIDTKDLQREVAATLKRPAR